MATALPNVRSFTEFARAGLGEGAGFVVGWLYWYFWVLVVPVEAIAGAKILHLWIPLPPLPIGIGLMTVMTCVNLMSARSYAEFEFWFASIKGRGHPGVHCHSDVLRIWLDGAAWIDLRQPGQLWWFYAARLDRGARRGAHGFSSR